MKVGFFFTLILLLASNWWPPHNVGGQPNRMPPSQVFVAPEPPDTSAANLIAEIDSNTIKAAMLNDKTKQIMKGQDELSKSIPKLVQQVKKADDPAPVYIIHQTDKDTAKERIYVQDTAVDNRRWWAKYRSLLKQCTIKKDVKRFTNKIFKRGKS